MKEKKKEELELKNKKSDNYKIEKDSFTVDFLGIGKGYEAKELPIEEKETKIKNLSKNTLNSDLFDCLLKVKSEEKNKVENSQNKKKSFKEIIEENKHGKGMDFEKVSDSKVKKSFGKDKSGSKPFKNR